MLTSKLIKFVIFSLIFLEKYYNAFTHACHYISILATVSIHYTSIVRLGVYHTSRWLLWFPLKEYATAGLRSTLKLSYNCKTNSSKLLVDLKQHTIQKIFLTILNFSVQAHFIRSINFLYGITANTGWSM